MNRKLQTNRVHLNHGIWPAPSWLLAALIAVGVFAWQVLLADNVTYTYDAAGRLTSVNYGNGQSITYTYDAAGNITRKAVTVIADTDNDGMDDSWERLHFNTLTRDGSGDFDNDGASDLAEYFAGTSPRDASSLLKVTRTTATAGASATIQWSAVSGKHYRVQFTDTVSNPAWTDLAGDVQATATTATKTDNAIAGSAQRFYRIVLLP